MKAAARHIDISEAEVFGVATFYNQFRFVPLGKYHIVVCMGTACHTMGGQLILDGFERELDVEVGGVTADLQYSLDRVGCIGCCTKAPVVVINDGIYPKMTPYRVTEVLAGVRDKGARNSKDTKDNE
jgi:NADH-quinone oxidoreductase subunit E